MVGRNSERIASSNILTTCRSCSSSQRGKRAVRVFELFERGRYIRAPDRGGPVVAALPVGAKPMHGDRAQPGAKDPRPRLGIERRELARERCEHFLDEVVGVGGLEQVRSQPAADQRGVQIGESLPGGGVSAIAGPLQEAMRGVRELHAGSRPTDGWNKRTKRCPVYKDTTGWTERTTMGRCNSDVSRQGGKPEHDAFRHRDGSTSWLAFVFRLCFVRLLLFQALRSNMHPPFANACGRSAKTAWRSPAGHLPAAKKP